MPVETADELFGRGNDLYRDGNLQAAAEFYRRALELDPAFASASFNLGCTLDRLSGPAEAVLHFAKAASLKPAWCEAHGNLALALARTGRMVEAAAELEAAAALKGDDPGIRNNLGLALSALGRGEDAYASFREAIRLNPGYAEAHNNLAILLERHGRTSEAIASCQEALKLRPDYPEAHNNLANALKSQGRHAESLAQLREALRLRPDYTEAHSSLLFTLCYPAGIAEDAVAAAHLAFGAAHRFATPHHDNRPSPDRIVNIGYVSADFRAHAVARFIEPVLRHHDRGQFRIFCYSNVAVPDARSEALRKLSDSFVNIAGIPDEAACEMIRKDGIDILVDLSGHTADNRLLLFARKPAPVQMTWLGYPNTTGLDAIDYRITDGVTDPPGTPQRHYAEKLVRLEGTFSCFAPPEEAPDVADLPLLSRGSVTFGSFNNPAKIAPETVALWAAVLKGVPGSRMLVKGYSLADRGTRERLALLFAEQGIPPERLEQLGNTPSYGEHLDLYGRVDIALDTFPYHGTTTTCEALWMGVPVVTLCGNTHRSRVGTSILKSVGLESLVAHDPRQYVDVAAALAADTERLGRLRRSLRTTMAASPLTDGARFTAGLESAYREVWLRWCVGHSDIPGPGGGGRVASSAGSDFLQRGDLDRALKSFLAVLRHDGAGPAAMGGIEETLNRQMAAELREAVSRDARRLNLPGLPAMTEPIEDGTLEEAAEVLLAAGFVTPADLICHYVLDRHNAFGRHVLDRRISPLLGNIALAIGESSTAAEHFREAISLGDSSNATRIHLLKAEEAARLKPVPGRSQRFLLIKAWGYGFWSDVNHVLGQLLLAEMTGRIPVVHWGGNSLFSDDPAGNAFESFFEPVSRFTIEELARRSRSYYPSKWNSGNLAVPILNQFDGPGSRLSALHVLQRREDVVVSDFHYAVNDLAPWIAPGHRLHGKSTDEIYLDLCQRYLKVKSGITAKAEKFYTEKMAGRECLALHVRGGDKGGEDQNLALLNTLYHPEIERYLQHSPQAGLFLLTDDGEILSQYRARYGERVVTTSATRTGNAQGVHYQRHSSRSRLGEEVVVDVLLALRCQGFIGNGLSNVSCAVAQMKAWAPGTLRLLGARLDRLRQITLYRS